MFPDTKNKNIYGVWVGISMVFKIFMEHLWFKGDGAIPYGHDQHTFKRSLTQGTDYIWFMGGDLNSFQYIRASSI
jgi:hypothetical protein